ncbi:DNA polymerase III subunit gamma/tau [Escherichia coli]|nr:DNA polymerase III subunit gamma/tau [Escherichia coli]
MFGKDGYMDGPGGGAYPVNINGTTWVEGGGCKAHACGWNFIITLYNPKTHKVVGYYYNIDPGYLIWFGEIGVHEFAYLVKDYVNKTN